MLEQSSAMRFLVYPGGNWKYLSFYLISIINFYYIINKLIILVAHSH
jgi:hypothetical protein